MRAKKILGVLTVALLVVASAVQAEAPYVNAWTRQLGTVSADISNGVAVDANGNVYITGYTKGDLDGPNAGGLDAFLSKYDGLGTLAWTRQLGTGSGDESRGVAVDAAGNVYITGATGGDLGGPNAGYLDAFLSKYDGDGNLAWTRQLGTDSWDVSHGVAVDAGGNAYITGFEGDLFNPVTWDAFLSKYDGDGNLAWTRQLNSGSTDVSMGVAVDAGGNAYITGFTEGDLDGSNAGGLDAFLSKYDGAGTLAWTRQLGTGPEDVSMGVAVDAGGNVYITGETGGDLAGPNAGPLDGFLSKYDGDGNLAWTRQLGSGGNDSVNGVAVDADGNVYITGRTGGDLGGPNAGLADAFLAKYDGDGNLLWTQQLGTVEYDSSNGVAVDADGNVYITGHTHGDLGGPNAGEADAFLAKYVVPDPATLLLLGAAIPLVLKRRRNA